MRGADPGRSADIPSVMQNDPGMTFDSLRDFVETLEKAGELKRVGVPVSPDLEVAEILRRAIKAGGPALLFEDVKGYDMPIVANLFASDRRMKIALGVQDFAELGNRVTDILKADIPQGLLGKVGALPRLAQLAGYSPKEVKKGPVTEVVETADPSLAFLPALRTWPKDAGRFITFGLVLTKNPETGVRNLGIYRMQIHDERTAAMHWQVHKRGALHGQMAAELGRKVEAAVIIGADPATVFAGFAPVPEGLDKYLYAGLVRSKGIELVKCRTVDLEVPAHAEIVLEGYVDPGDMRVEGPFGDHTGYYSEPEAYPTFHLTGVMRRESPLCLAAVAGKPVMEDAYMGKAVERAFLPLVRFLQPEIADVYFPPSAWFQGLAVVSIRKRYPGHAKKVMMGLWGMGQLSLTKILVVVDHDVDVHDMKEVVWAVTTRTDPARDVMLLDGMPTDNLDPASPVRNLGSKMGVDATVKGPEEGLRRASTDQVLPDGKTAELVAKRWTEYGFGTPPA